MQKATREELVRRLTALSEDALDSIERTAPEGFQLGVVGMVFEVLIETEPEDHLHRSEAGYTTGDDVYAYTVIYASDHRRWIIEKLFEEAYDAANSPPDETVEDPES